MKNAILRVLIMGLTLMLISASCEKADNEKEWGEALIYMPQANYNPYTVPNSGTDPKLNKNYSIDSLDNRLNIFLGVYRSGLQELKSYTVDIEVADTFLFGTVIIPQDRYSLVSSITCPDGKRDATFYLMVDIDFLKANAFNDYSLVVKISNPSNYTLNPQLVSTKILIKTSELFTN